MCDKCVEIDKKMGGGIPEFSFNIIGGAPGSGKTTLAHQILFANATPEKPALYFTVLGEPALKMLRYQQQYSFFDLAKVNKAIRFVNLGDAVLEGRQQEGVRLGLAGQHLHGPLQPVLAGVVLAEAGQPEGEEQVDVACHRGRVGFVRGAVVVGPLVGQVRHVQHPLADAAEALCLW